MRSGNDVALNFLELRFRLFHGELLVSARLLKHLPPRRDTTEGAARCHGFDIGIEELFRRLEIMRRDGLDELTCAGEPHRRNPSPPANTILKLASIAKGKVLPPARLATRRTR